MPIQDDDILLVNRGGASFKTEYSEIKQDIIDDVPAPPAGDFLPLDGGNLTGGVTQTERAISGGFDLSTGNFWDCDVTTVPATSNGVNGQSGLIRFSTVPTGWDTQFTSVPQTIEVGDIIPFYVLSPTSIALGTKSIVGEVSQGYTGPSAWGEFNASGNLNAGLNCSVSKTGTGTYQVTFDNPIGSASYSVVASQPLSANRGACFVNDKLSTGFVITTGDNNGDAADVGANFVVHAENATPPRGGTGADAWIAMGSGGAVNASFNLTSSKVSEGVYDFSFVNDMPSTNYAVTAVSVSSARRGVCQISNYQVSGFRVTAVDHDGLVVDTPLSVIVHATNAQLPDTVTQEQIDAALEAPRAKWVTVDSSGAATAGYAMNSDFISQGKYQIYFTPPLTNTNYAAAVSGAGAMNIISAKTTDGFVVDTLDSSGNAQNYGVDVIVFAE